MPKTFRGKINKDSTGDGRVSPIRELERDMKGEKRKGRKSFL